jgi:hypothetical protein
MEVSKVLGNVITPLGNQAIVQLINGRYAVGNWSDASVVPESEQLDDFELAFDRWYEVVHESL